MNNILIVSDLHMGDGGPLEDFHHDDGFSSFLDEYGKHGGVDLILNGDIVDFLQVQPLGSLTVEASAGKLERSFTSHAAVIDALARFTKSGNNITLIEGNHDIEFLFEDVQQALTDLLRRASGDASRLQFRRTVELAPHLYVEHGHQYDPLNAFDYSNLFAQPATRTLRLPWGSRFVLRVFNNVEPDFRFIDKVRPEGAAGLLIYVLNRRMFYENLIPLLGLKVEGWLNDLRKALRSKPRAGMVYKSGPGAETPLEFAEVWEDLLNDVEILERSGMERADAVSKAGIDPVVRRIIEHLQGSWESDIAKADSYDVQAAEAKAEEKDAKVVVFGHTHHMGRKRFENGRHYINSGTWTPLLRFPDRAKTDEWVKAAREGGSYSLQNAPTFVQVEIGASDCNAELMTWDPQTRRAVPAGY